MPSHNIKTLMDFHKQKPVANDNDIIVCDCGNSWMEVIELEQFLKEYQIVLGQRPPKKNYHKFFMLRCPVCLKLHEPTVQFGGRDLEQDIYLQFLNQLTKFETSTVETKDPEENI